MFSKNNQANLQELKIKLREKYPQLTEEDLLPANGSTNDMMRMVEYKLGKTKKEMRAIIANF